MGDRRFDEDPSEQRPWPAANWARRDTLATVLCVVLVAMMVFPIYGIGNRATPIVLGMPFSLFWIVMWVMLGAVALFLLYYFDSGDDESQEGDR